MSAPRIAARYAEALFGLAQQRDIVDTLRSQLSELTSLVNAAPELRGLLERADLAAERRIAALAAAFGGKFSNELVATLVALVRHQRGHAVAQVSEAFGEMADRAAELVVAEAATVVALTSEQHSRLVAAIQRMTGKQVRLEQRVDPGVLAGVRLTVGDRLIDGSADGRLTRMREELMSLRG
ncbi:MAG: ATP synthase F1 subunit delta [Armatimonadota bacterium]